MVYHGSWWDIMIFIVPALFLMVPGLVFMVPGGFSWFQVSFHGSRSVFMVPGRFSWFLVGFHGSWSVFMVFHGSRLFFSH